MPPGRCGVNVLALLAVGLMVMPAATSLSFGGVGPAVASPAFTGALRGVSLLTSAAASLIAGAGPAHGQPLTCSSSNAPSVSCGAAAGYQWVNTTLPGGPGQRELSTMTYDGADGYVLLFGGCGRSCSMSDTWSFSQGLWTNLTPSLKGESPQGRSDSAMAYDAHDGIVVMFGGLCPTGFLADTWGYVGGSWFELSSGYRAGPPPRYGTSLTYDAADQSVIMFGGGGYYQGRTLLNDTWSFNYQGGSKWTHVNSAARPAARTHAMATYDAADGYLVLFGGEVTNGAAHDTWKYLAGNWTLLTTRVTPTGREGATMVYDPVAGYVVMFGGLQKFGFLNDSWKFLAGNWSGLASPIAPPARSWAVSTWDNTTNSILLVGGWRLSTIFADQWAFGTPPIAAPLAPLPSGNGSNDLLGAVGLVTLSAFSGIYVARRAP